MRLICVKAAANLAQLSAHGAVLTRILDAIQCFWNAILGSGRRGLGIAEFE